MAIGVKVGQKALKRCVSISFCMIVVHFDQSAVLSYVICVVVLAYDLNCTENDLLVFI